MGIEEDEDRVILSYMFISSTFSFDLFKTVLANFVDLVETWQEKIETLKSESATKKTVFEPDFSQYRFLYHIFSLFSIVFVTETTFKIVNIL